MRTLIEQRNEIVFNKGNNNNQQSKYNQHQDFPKNPDAGIIDLLIIVGDSYIIIHYWIK